MRRRPDPEGDAAWARVAASVRPLPGREAPPVPAGTKAAVEPVVATLPIRDALPVRQPARATGLADNTLDAGWDRRLAKGLVAADLTIDLHGHTLAGAHLALDAGLARAFAREARLVLLVTGRPPRGPARGFEPRRGAIRAQVMDWLAGSSYAGRIAAVRGAHPRHGGLGALYVVLRRTR
jgi:DNA-nicking Smr family endonuclease